MTTDTEAYVLGRVRELMLSRGYQPEDGETLRKDHEATFGLVHLVIHNDGFMPRLSVGVRPFSSTGVVLSTDLRALVPSDRFLWYGSGRDDLLRMERDLIETGLPWLESHLDLERLTRALESKRTFVPPPPARRWRWSKTPAATRAESRVSPVILKALSYCYELQSRYGDALDSWRGYVATKTLGPGDELLERLRLLEAKARGEA